MSVQHRASQSTVALLGEHAATWPEHLDRFGPLPRRDGPELLHDIAESGLTGRGGGQFRTSRKLALVAGTPDAIVIANAAEGEPASSKDRVLLSDSPHLVLDGLALVARIAGTRSTHLAGAADLLDDVVAPALRADPNAGCGCTRFPRDSSPARRRRSPPSSVGGPPDRSH